MSYSDAGHAKLWHSDQTEQILYTCVIVQGLIYRAIAWLILDPMRCTDLFDLASGWEMCLKWPSTLYCPFANAWLMLPMVTVYA
jgi:hypothetical protein